jgi:hypothetical protein
MTVATCSVCGTTRDLADLLRVEAGGLLRGPRAVERIDLADPGGERFETAGLAGAEGARGYPGRPPARPDAGTATPPEPDPAPSPLGLSAADELAAAVDPRPIRLLADRLFDRGLGR